ncbi:MAG TPA: SdrD B-like domain-containing protein, partial [Candidatus Nanoperiomorbaceae bacterium]|nr:SdrD B-like domain-containing protein [Candidatus Nanoperiomorbaceae bacterium]
DGSYEFNGLTPGDYIVEFDTPTGYEPTDANQGGDDALDSDADETTGQSAIVNLESGENDNTIDAGFGRYDLALAKVLSANNPATFAQGSAVEYDITVTNEGGLPASNVVVTDRFPTGLTQTGFDANGTSVIDNGNGTFTIPSLLEGQSLTFKVTATIDMGFQGFELTNEAEITTDDGEDKDSTPDNDNPAEDDQDEVTVPVAQTAEVDIEKLTNGEDADTAPGVVVLVPNTPPTITWSYVVTNTGTLDLTNVVVTDDQEGVIGTIPFLAAGDSQTLTATGTAILGLYTNVADVNAQPVDSNGNPFGDPVTDEDPSNYVGVFINVEKNVDKEEICAGETVNFTLTVRMLGGAPGIQLRGISVVDNNLPGMLMPYDGMWIGGDLNGNGFIDFIDNNNDGKSDEEFVWGYSLSYDQTTTNMAMDEATIWANDVETMLMPMGMDEVTVTVNPDLCAQIGDFVWEDMDADGVQDAGEPGIGGVTVNLLDGNGNFLETTTTQPDGFYQFTGLIPGDYIVEFVQPAGYESTTADQGGDDALDSDADETTGQSPVITIANGDDIQTIDAGYYILASLGDFVWSDTDADGVQD